MGFESVTLLPALEKLGSDKKIAQAIHSQLEEYTQGKIEIDKLDIETLNFLNGLAIGLNSLRGRAVPDFTQGE